jgi:hypothetical protein
LALVALSTGAKRHRLEVEVWEQIAENFHNIRDMLLPFSAYLVVLPSPESEPHELLGQGTGTLVWKAEAGPLLVTARHVYDEICRMRSQYPTACAAVGEPAVGLAVLESLQPVAVTAAHYARSRPWAVHPGNNPLDFLPR